MSSPELSYRLLEQGVREGARLVMEEDNWTDQIFQCVCVQILFVCCA